MTNEGVEVHSWFNLLFNHTDEAIETLESVHFLGVTDFRGVERIAEEA